PKRTGGLREINHPTPPLKFLQRWLVKNVFYSLPVNDSVKSYRSGIGILDVAAAHARNSYLLRTDFANFFPSLTGDDIRALIVRNRKKLPLIRGNDDIDVIIKIVCRNNQLTIGAPRSPALSNALLFEFDLRISNYCKKHVVAYTRYADDLFFSTNQPNVLKNVLETVKETIRGQRYPRLHLNESKTVFTSRKRRRIVTGLVLSSENKISLGRNKKRYIRSLVHKYRLKQLSESEISYLRGFLSYAKSVEPNFIGGLMKKFGTALIHTLLSEALTPRKVTPSIGL
ncbi:MAG: retron St85 family RNA-directed DNA polymerase, partial [Blastocatellia bacterium]